MVADVFPEVPPCFRGMEEKTHWKWLFFYESQFCCVWKYDR